MQWSPEREEGLEKVLVEMVAKIFSDLMEMINLRTQEGQHPPTTHYRKKTTRGYILINGKGKY